MDILSILFPLTLLFTAAAMVVLRAGASRVFFDVVGTFQANRLIADVEAKVGVINSIMLDGLAGIGESVTLITDQMQQLVDSTVPLAQEVAEARLEFEKFAAGIEGSEALRKDIVKTGEAYGFTATQAMDAGSKMAQLSGLFGGSEAVGAATEAGLAFGMIGNLETEDAMKRIIQLHQQTGALYGGLSKQQYLMMSAEEQANIVRGNSAKLLDELNTIENRSAANMAQITHVMNQFASSGQLAGDSISYMAAMSATLIEAGEEQGKAGRALKMIYARLGADTGNNAEILAHYGVQTKTVNGSLRSMEEIVGDLGQIWPSLTDAQKLQISQSIAGNDHYVRAIKLLDGHSRTLKLNELATRRADSATDEVNKKLQDQAYQLKQVEARLHNATAAIGHELTPAVIHATKEQAIMNEAFADLVSNEQIGGIVKIGYVLKNYISLYAPLGEAYLNMMSLNVSLKTQETIMRSLAGAEIVRASAYGGKANQQQASLMNLQQELYLMDMIASIEAENLQLATQEARMDAIKNNTTQQISQQDMDRVRAKLAINTMIYEQEEQHYAHVQMLQQTLTQEEMKQLETEKLHLVFLENELRLNQKKNDSVNMYNLALDEAVRNNSYLGSTQAKTLTDEQKRVQIAKNKNFVSNTNNAIIDETLMLLQEEKQLEHQIANILTNIPHLRHVGTSAAKKENAELGKQINQQQTIIASELQGVLNSQMAGQATQGHTMAELILNQAMLHGSKAIAGKGNVQARQNALSQVGASAATALGAAYGVEASQIQRIIMQLPGFIALQNQLEMQTKKQMQTRMLYNNTMMATSGMLGMASMLLTTLTDNEDAARVAMVLMMLSMVPATIQMFSMGTGAMTAAGGLGTMGTAAAGAAVGMTSLKMAMISTGIGALVVLIGSAIAYFGDWESEIADTDQAMKDFQQTITYTKDEMEGMEARMDGLTLDEKVLSEKGLREDIIDLEGQLADATNETNRKYLQNRLDMRNKELAILVDIISLEGSQQLATNEKQARQVFDRIQQYKDEKAALKDTRDAALAYEDATESGGEKVRDFVLGGLGQDDWTDESYIKDWYSDERADAWKDALKDIPDEYHGFITETANASDTFEEFLDTINEWAIDYPDFNFDTFGEDIDEFVIGPLEAAKEAAFEFGSAREEMFFGAAKGNITGEMVKQVVNKGVETLINTVEVIMTNTFNGMTTKQAANQIVAQIEQQLSDKGVSFDGSETFVAL